MPLMKRVEPSCKTILIVAFLPTTDSNATERFSDTMRMSNSNGREMPS